MSQLEKKAIIIGGGIAGPALALFLKKIGMESTVYEAYPQSGDIGGGFQIAPNGMKVLGALGLAPQIIENGYHAPQWRFLDPQGKIIARCKVGNVKKYGQPAIALPRAAMHNILLEEVERQGIEIKYQKRLKDITYEEAKVTAHFEDGTTTEGDFLVGADGVRSATRRIIMPEAAKPVYTGILGFGGFAPQSVVRLTPQAQQSLNMAYGPAGFFGYCMVREDQVTWWTNREQARELSQEELARLGDEEILKELLTTFKGWHEPVETFLKNSGPVIKTNIYETPSLPAWHKGRVVLIGDAAHAMNPSAGQGASVSLEDAMYLAKLLRESPNQLDKVFTRFEQDRRPRVEKVIAQARRASGGKNEVGPVAAWLRNKMMGIMMPLIAPRSTEWLYSYNIQL